MRWQRVSQDSDDGLSAPLSITKFLHTATLSRHDANRVSSSCHSYITALRECLRKMREAELREFARAAARMVVPKQTCEATILPRRKYFF